MTCPPDFDQLIADCEVAGPVSESAIVEAERALGVRFPPSYRAFVAKYGAALGTGFEIAGLFHYTDQAEPPRWCDVTALNLQIRRAARGQIPVTHLAISDDGVDYTFYLDTNAESPDSPVVVSGPGANDVLVASNFHEFFVALATHRLVF